MSPSLPKTYKAAFMMKANEPMELRDVELKMPGPTELLVKVLACGVCHTDNFMHMGAMGDLFPRVPGHEAIGEVVAVGSAVKGWKVGERAGGSWHGGHDGTCRSCQRGLFQMCDAEAINGVTMDGGYAEYVTLRSEAAVRIPPEVDPAEAAPLMCAGVTVFNAMRKMHVEAGALVAVQGLGGLGHLAVQYASRMGYRVAALSHGSSKRDFAKKLGAHIYIDTTAQDPVKELQALGGAEMVVATAPDSKAMSNLVYALASCGKFVVLPPMGPVEFDTQYMVSKGISVCGWPSGHALDSEECVDFSQLHGVNCMIEKFPLSKANDAFAHMMSGKARFRVVLVME